MDQDYYSPVTKQGVNTFENIIATAKRLFADKGYHSTSINKIIEESNIATGTFYIYFKDKISLYKFILQEYKKKIRDHIHNATKDCKNRYELERQGLKAFIEFAYDDILSYNIIWESLFVDRNLFTEYYSNFAERYKAGLIHANENGEIRDVDFETLAYILMGIANFVGLQVIFKKIDQNSEKPDIDKIVDSIMDILYNGMFKVVK